MVSTKFSVIITVYNGERFIGGAVRSALAQTWKDVEVIVVDDGSRDGTGEILSSFGSSIKVVARENGGVPGLTRNTGIRHATGEVIFFLDYDDEWDQDHLEACARAMAGCPGAKWGFSDFRRFDVRNESFYPKTNTQLNPGFLKRFGGREAGFCEISSKDVLVQLLNRYAVYPSTFFARKDFLFELNLWCEDPGLKGNEDLEMTLRAAMKRPAVYVDKPSVMVKWHGGNLSRNMIGQKVGDIRVLEALRKRGIVNKEYKRLWNRFYCLRLARLAYVHRTNNDPAAAAKYYKMAVSAPDAFILLFPKIFIYYLLMIMLSIKSKTSILRSKDPV